MKPVKKCLVCNSKRVNSLLCLENEIYYQKINCKKCGYINKLELGESISN